MITDLQRNKHLRLNRWRKPIVLSAPNQLLCALIGLLLTIGGTFIKAYTLNVPWDWLDRGIQLEFLGINYQIGAVLFTGCLGGKNAGAIAQIAYLFIGLTSLPVFDRGGGLEYIQQPSFGYLLGFIPGAWLCGWLAFQSKAKLERLAFSSICGLTIIHLCGVVYIIGLSYFPPTATQATPLDWITQYSLYPLPGQLVIICALSLVAFVLRRIMFY